MNLNSEAAQRRQAKGFHFRCRFHGQLEAHTVNILYSCNPPTWMTGTLEPLDTWRSGTRGPGTWKPKSMDMIHIFFLARDRFNIHLC